jgi:hypothetical protein
MHAFEPTRNTVDRLAFINYSTIGARVNDIAELEDFGVELGALVYRELVYILKGLNLLG